MGRRERLSNQLMGSEKRKRNIRYPRKKEKEWNISSGRESEKKETPVSIIFLGLVNA